jgi:Flp pilus assembly protein TadD
MREVKKMKHLGCHHHLLPRVSILFVLVLLLMPVAQFGQIAGGLTENTNIRMGGNNPIVGTIFWPDGRPVDVRMPIRLRTPANGDVIANTDEAGRFSFSGISAGLYALVIETEPEFEPVREEIDVMRNRSPLPETYTLSIRLRERAQRKADSEKPGVVSVNDVSVPKSAKKFYEKAIELARAGDRKGAIEQLKLAVDKFPQYIAALNELGVQYLRLGELGNAEEYLRQALKINPKAYEPMINLGIDLFRQNRFPEAEVVLRDALKANDISGVPEFYLGRTLNKLNRNDEAEAALIACLKKDPIAFNEARRILSVIYLQKGMQSRVVEELEAYLKIAPSAKDAGDLRKIIEQNRSPKEFEK